MAHFAEVDSNNIVLRVIVVSNDDVLDNNGQESEQVGIDFCKNIFGQNTNWVQASYNNNIRGVFPCEGFIWNPELNIFYPPQPFPSWFLNVEMCAWLPPVPLPDDHDSGTHHATWNEDLRRWDIVEKVQGQKYYSNIPN